MSSNGAGTRRATGTKVAHGMMREVNSSIVLDILREGNPVSRVELARRTHLSKPTVSSIIDDLMSAGLAREVGITASKHRTGRPPSLLVYNESASAFAGIQFGVNTTHVAIADGLGNILSTAQVPAVHGDVNQSVRDAQRALRTALRKSGVKRQDLRAAGVIVPGLLDPRTGMCMLAPNLDWHDVPIQERLEAALGLPVVIANLTHGGAIAEARARGDEHRVLVWVYAGSGVGAGIVLDGVLFTGANGFAGEFGHSPMIDNGIRCSCGNYGCLETVSSTGAIVRAAGKLLSGVRGSSRRPPHGPTAEVIAHLTALGDPAGLAVLRQAGDYLGRGIADLINVLSPSLIVLGGPLVMMSSVYVDAARESAARHAMSGSSVPLQVTALGPQAPLLGVVQLAIGQSMPSYRFVDQVMRS